MRRLPKSLYGTHAPNNKNRSCKYFNMLVGKASIFPAYKTWSKEQLQKWADRCHNPTNNCFYDELKFRDAQHRITELKKTNRKPEPKAE